MITKVNIEGQERLSISMLELADKEDVEMLQEALLDLLTNIVSYNESKNAVKAISLWWLSGLISTLNEDIKKL